MQKVHAEGNFFMIKNFISLKRKKVMHKNSIFKKSLGKLICFAIACRPTSKNHLLLVSD